ncbi:hypothetical protein [Oxynema aestuarii]|uniref:vWA-MoxR associated protein N-terminal HTH domain-containing protein n=1 Tax=Oxynema aestuarii AP17 TaxID=2064643 RepID=A0A6H1TXS0_9CYAN|nr:hypothetical protein [Oxynema aestuarii]QIZ70149.1 hypothetical protein HCG48_05835 [Oxynema aestuarii AP17]
MRVDEALALVEMVLEDDAGLSDVQELIFRQCWERRQSYQEIAQVSGYDYEYIKATGAKLWKLLSEAFGEKVKKGNLQSVLKRYLRRNQITVHRDRVIGVNLSGATISGTRVVGNLHESNFCQANLYKAKKPEDKTGLEEEDVTREPVVNPIADSADSTSEMLSYSWNGWQFRSLAEVKIAEALDRAGVLFFPKATARLATPDGRQNEDPHFLICYEGKLGILAVDFEEADEGATDRLFQSQGIHMIHHYNVTECSAQSDRVVLEFLQHLSQA